MRTQVMTEKPEPGAGKGNTIVTGGRDRRGGAAVRRGTRFLMFGCFLCLLIMGVGSHAMATSDLPVNNDIISQPAISEEEILEAAQPYLGARYRRGGTGLRGIDCSGLVRKVYSDLFSLDLPHSSAQQYKLPILTKVPTNDLQTGDLLFFSQKKRRITHVGIYLSDGNFLHASSKSGVTISSLDSHYWRTKIVGAKRPVGLERDNDNEQDEPAFDSLDQGADTSGGMGHRLNGLVSSWLTLGTGLRPLSWGDISSANSLSKDQSRRFEFEFGQTFGESSWRMSLLQEGTYRYFPRERDGLASPSISHPSARQYTLVGYRQGVRMAGDLDPVGWLRITPSFSYVGYEQGEEEIPSWGPGLGLSVQIRPFLGWSLAADFQCWDDGIRTERGLGELDGWQNRNLSLMVGYDLSTDLRFSLVGQQGMGSLFRGKNGPPDREERYNGVFFKLDWAF